MKKYIYFMLTIFVLSIPIVPLNAEKIVRGTGISTNLVVNGASKVSPDYNQGSDSTVTGSLKNDDSDNIRAYGFLRVYHKISGPDAEVCYSGGYISKGQSISCSLTNSSYKNDVNYTSAHYTNGSGKEDEFSEEDDKYYGISDYESNEQYNFNAEKADKSIKSTSIFSTISVG